MMPSWLQNPNDPLAPKELTDDVRKQIIIEVCRSIGDLSPDDYDIEEVFLEAKDTPEFKAMVESETIRRTAQIMDVAGHSIEAQAVTAAQSGMHAYHPQHFGSVIEMLEDALQETKYGSTEFYNLRTVINTIVPYCMSHGIEIPEGMMDDGNSSKVRYLADYMGSRVKEAGAAGDIDEDLEKFLGLVADPDTTISALREEFPPSPASGLPPLHAVNYVQGRGGYIVLRYEGQPQFALLQRALGKKTEWSLGTGTERFLSEIIAKKGR